MSSSSSSSWTSDLVSGFLVFLIALPLCLGISMASGVPPVSGVLTAIVGGCLATWLGSAKLTIKGPAAGLIVIVLGAVTELGMGDPMAGYRRMLAASAVASVVQIGLALARAGILGEAFPPSVVHGMLAAIGVIICSKQVHVLMGVKPEATEPLELIAEIPHSFAHANPEILAIGLVSLVILVLHLVLKDRVRAIAKLPAPMLVLVLAVPLGLFFDLGVEHQYAFLGHPFSIGPSYLVNLPDNLLSAITYPDFGMVFSGASLKYVVMFALVGSIESLLSAKAVDLLDPEHGKSDLDRDLLATGAGNLVASMIGGIPMISEIVRSSANIAYGARSRLSNFFHGVSLLFSVGLLAEVVHHIPLAALAAMLIVTGVRLASPSEFRKTLQIGPDQLLVFSVTLLMTLATDLLVGVGAGIVAELAIHLWKGAPPRSLFRPQLDTELETERAVVRVREAVVFSNVIGLKRELARLDDHASVVVDMSEAKVVDHTVMEKLHHLAADFERAGRALAIVGLDDHKAASKHPLASRRKHRGKSRRRRGAGRGGEENA